MTTAPVSADVSAQVVAIASAASSLTIEGSPLARHLLQHLAELEAKTADPIAKGWTARASAVDALAESDLGRAAKALETALMAFEAIGSRATISTRTTLGYTLFILGQQARAEHELRRSLADATRRGFHDHIADACENLGALLTYSGKLEEATSLLRRATELFVARGDARCESLSRAELAMALHLAGRSAEAEQQARLAESRVEGGHPARALALTVIARLAIAQRRGEEAVEAAREAVALAEAGTRLHDLGVTVAPVVYAEALHAAGLHEQARAAIRHAHELLMKRAGTIGDRALRDEYVAFGPENARIEALAREWDA
jgi:tetratricopeptide (TPR) repeat protein